MTLAGGAAIPAEAASVAANITITGATDAGWITVYPGGEAAPDTSTQNLVAGLTRANFDPAKLGSGALAVRNQAGNTHVVIDVFGWFGA